MKVANGRGRARQAATRLCLALGRSARELCEGIEDPQAGDVDEVVSVPGDQGQVVQEGSARDQRVTQLILLA